jgi:transaldolase / glucose-6-phosphate isomerase
MPLEYKPGADLAARLLAKRLVSRIWAGDVSVWHAVEGTAESRSISTRLGWLDVGKTMSPELPRVERLGRDAAADRISAVYLLGMGGSSLCAEVIRAVFGVAEGRPELFVLDTTDEQTIATAAARMDPARTWFLVASKSGTTVEVASLERFFWSRVSAALGKAAGRQFVAITDPGTALERLARARGYREVFLNPADIGGRFSALSLFGLVPAALVGAPAQELVTAGQTMAEGCRQENHMNAGLELGAYIGAAAANGRDKLTVVLPPSLSSLGLWIEQLIAESTGKHGKGALPVVDERLGRPDEYGSDRAFVSIATERDRPDEHKLKELEEAGHPVMHLSTRLDGLGAEFFRWEFATAVAGAALGINPFDEPNVQQAKDATRVLLQSYGQQHRLPLPEPHAALNGARLTLSEPAVADLAGRPAQSFLQVLRTNDYVGVLAYVPSDDHAWKEALQAFRIAVARRIGCATTVGYGPRYLHSTGQLHKGGPNNGVFIVITAEPGEDLAVPGEEYSFGVLESAQALGDFQSLERTGRRALLVRLPRRDVTMLQQVGDALLAGVRS